MEWNVTGSSAEGGGQKQNTQEKSYIPDTQSHAQMSYVSIAGSQGIYTARPQGAGNPRVIQMSRPRHIRSNMSSLRNRRCACVFSMHLRPGCNAEEGSPITCEALPHSLNILGFRVHGFMVLGFFF